MKVHAKHADGSAVCGMPAAFVSNDVTEVDCARCIRLLARPGPRQLLRVPVVAVHPTYRAEEKPYRCSCGETFDTGDALFDHIEAQP